ncbi:hypothetical protein M8C21_005545 [Ambrosia artemisiifolia]|uniref:Pectin acetylesterase n=1 Tax=Ambrosia artemisiifolia TaxID=4212 RepID=A0AAD5GK75_AMBAR|nr:hypothetical protein M8C21_005545 [Ambrosia artemisiifolia]
MWGYAEGSERVKAGEEKSEPLPATKIRKEGRGNKMGEFVGEEGGGNDDVDMEDGLFKTPGNRANVDQPEVTPVNVSDGQAVQKETVDEFNAFDGVSKVDLELSNSEMEGSGNVIDEVSKSELEFANSNLEGGSNAGENCKEYVTVGPTVGVKRKKVKNHIVLEQLNSGGPHSSNDRPMKEPKKGVLIDEAEDVECEPSTVHVEDLVSKGEDLDTDEHSDKAIELEVANTKNLGVKMGVQLEDEVTDRSYTTRTPVDMPILGMVAPHWNADETVDPPAPPKWWDGNGFPNSTNKYKEDQKVSWHATPFEERLEKALSEDRLIAERYAWMELYLGIIYIADMVPGANSWIVHLEGRGWCNSVRTCVYRKTTRRGSSNYFEKQLAFTGIMNNKAQENPDFFNWNRVKIHYCDGVSFTGDSEDKVDTRI